VTDVRRFRLDDLRRFILALAAGVGVSTARASALASNVLWFDAAGAAHLGIATLPDCLGRLANGAIDSHAEGRVISERSASAVFDGERGIPLLVLERAAGLASEKARECGAGLVRVVNAPATGSAAGIAAEVALGPAAALILGPGASWTVALPSAEGLPIVFEPALASELGGKAGRSNAAKVGAARQALARLLAPWAAVLAPGEGWLVAALSITAMESLSTFHERVADTLHGLDEADGLLLPTPWEARRCEARARGVSVRAASWKALQTWADRLAVEVPVPLAH
jgi:LDH2 family malate/lactate/ureidoglycolate dehydrogenase